MSTTFERLFGPVDSHPTAHPAAAVPAGLSSGGVARAIDRHSPWKDSREYARPIPSTWQKPLPVVVPTHDVADIGSTSPSRRPIAATSDTAHQFRTHRTTDPLSPVYNLPSPSQLPGVRQDMFNRSSARPVSRSLDCSDIVGSRPRSEYSPARPRPSNMDYSDVPGTRPKPFGLPVTIPSCTITTQGIPGASPSRPTSREITSPGRGTLRNDDIRGATPGSYTQRALAPTLRSSWSLGQQPMPVVPRFRFAMGARKTVLQKPSNMMELVNYEQLGIPKNAGTASSDRFDLGRMRRLLHRLGNPHKQWPAVHVAGSKGKGSTVAFLSSILRCAGYTVGTYTSPHLMHISERIAVGPVRDEQQQQHGEAAQRHQQPHHEEAVEQRQQQQQQQQQQMESAQHASFTLAAHDLGSNHHHHLSPQEFDALVLEHGQLLEDAQRQENGALSHFEVVTALAFRCFADRKVDIAVIETGLGGTTDATNVIEPDNLAAAVITSLGYEHLEALGWSLQSIAAAKAGIMKQGRPVVVAAQQYGEALQVLLDRAAQLHCPLVQADKHVTVESRGMALSQQPSLQALAEQLLLLVDPTSSGSSSGGASALLGLPGPITFGPLPVHLSGRHQHDNAAAAVCAALCLRAASWQLPDSAIALGLQRASMRGRFQVIRLPAASPQQQLPQAVASAVAAAPSPSSALTAFTPTATPADTAAPAPSAAAAASPASAGPHVCSRGAQYVVLDGAHTAESAASLARAVRTTFPGSPVALVVAMAADKEHRQVLQELRALSPVHVIFTSVPIASSYQRAAPADSLMKQWQELEGASRGEQSGSHPSSSTQGTLEAAYAQAKETLATHHGKGVVIVTGSLHAVAKAINLADISMLGEIGVAA